jgi:hypothetical protein
MSRNLECAKLEASRGPAALVQVPFAESDTEADAMIAELSFLEASTRGDTVA